jgi:WD40 repeat protein
MATRTRLRTFADHGGAVNSVAFSPDGRYMLSGSDDGAILLWDAATHRPLRRYAGHGVGAQGGAFSPDSRSFVSAGPDRTLRRWRIDTREELLAWTDANRYVPKLTCDQQQLYGLEAPCVAPGDAQEDA